MLTAATSSTVSNTARRRGLEWDYSEDLGLGEARSQGQAAASLSTLEKLAIGSYSEFLREEPEGEGRQQQQLLPQAGQDEMVESRMSKFADSLMRQRETQERERQRRRSLSREAREQRPVAPGSGEEEGRPRVLPPRCSPVKFSSMSDVRQSSDGPPEVVASSLSTSAVASPSSLPPHLADLVVTRAPRRSASRDSLTLSRTSAGNSIETVVLARREERSEFEDTEDEVAAVRRSLEGATSREDTPLSSYSEGAVVAQRCLPPPPRQAWREERMVEGEGERRRRVPQSSEPSSVPSTSDEEMPLRPRNLQGRRVEVGEDTSTMESARLVDRAKSFEYIPGSSFPLQENSSSYEYLPGHLVPEQRPPTVLTVGRPGSAGLGQEEERGLEHVSAQLRDRSRDLLAANLQQTRQFFRKLKGYIDFLASPSLTVEDCRVKQELATRIQGLLATEETRLASPQSSPAASEHSELPAISVPQPRRAISVTSSEQSSLRSASRLSGWRQERTRSEEQWQDRSNEAELGSVLAARTQHLRRIRREVKKLEQLDSWVAGWRNRGRLEGSVSELSVQTTVSSVVTDTHVSVSSRGEQSREERVASQREERRGSRREEKEGRRGGKLASLNEESRDHRVGSSQKDGLDSRQNDTFIDRGQEEQRGRREERVASLREERAARKENIAPTEEREHFGQMFPSDVEEVSRIETRTVTNTTATITLQSISIQTETVDTSDGAVRSRRSPRKRRARSEGRGGRPVAYFLPLESLSPVRLGQRVLREVGGGLQEHHLMSAGNRDRLAGYVAGLAPRPSTAPASRPAPAPQPAGPPLSLQEALRRRRGDFLRSTEARVRAMGAAREARMLRREKQTAWLEEVARCSPRSRRLAKPSYSPVVVPRLFQHREMVTATRQKFLQLPETVNKKHDIKKSGRYRTNRLMAEIFSNQLQRKVSQGQS